MEYTAAPRPAAVYPNPNYRRPTWNEVKAHLDTLAGTAEKLLYLRYVLKEDLQNAEAAPEDLQDVFRSNRTESGWELMEIGYPERFSDDMLEHFEAETERFRERLKLEIGFLEQAGPIDQARQVKPEDAELGGPIYWNKDQQTFAVWLYQSYQRFMAYRGEPSAEPADFKQFVQAMAPLFHYWRGGKRKAFNAATIHKNAQGYEKGDEEVEGVLEKAERAGE